MTPTRGVRSWETAANESQRRSESAWPKELAGRPLKDGIESKVIDIFVTGRGAPDGVTIGFREPSGSL